MMNRSGWHKASDTALLNVLSNVLVALENKVVTETTYLGSGRFFKHGFDNFPYPNNPIVKWRYMPKAPK